MTRTERRKWWSTRGRRATPTSPESALLRRTTWRLGLQIALSVAIIVVVLSGLAILIVLRGQQTAATTLLQQAASRADDVTDPPADVWLVIQNGHRRSTTVGLPKGLPDLAALDRVAGTGTPETDDVTAGCRSFQVYTQRRGPETVQAVLDLTANKREQTRLLTAMLASGALGLVLAAAAGVWFGRQAVRPVTAALALQRRFVSDASHELRTPLTLLSTRAQIHRRHLANGAEARVLTEEAEGVVTDAGHLADILEDLLLAADARPGNLTEAVDLVELVDDTVAAAVSEAAERSVTITVRHDEQMVVRGTRGGLRRAVTSLLDNAVRHAHSTVDVTVGRAGQDVVIEVSDDGPGVDPAILPHLFARFATQAGDGVHLPERGQRRRYGIGLALVSEIATRHGGRVSSHDRPGGGAVLRLTLPLAADGNR
jgi:two-component system, OmpR family, sensor kinase